VITKLSPLVYPPTARATRTTGDVILILKIQPNGSVTSATVVSGHPLLSQFALENAQRSQFACNGCGEKAHPYRLVYTFELESPSKDTASVNEQAAKIDPQHPFLRISQSDGHVIVVDEPFFTVDLGPDRRRVRSATCLYLWRCGWSQ
jgi:TonB family protein